MHIEAHVKTWWNDPGIGMLLGTRQWVLRAVEVPEPYQAEPMPEYGRNEPYWQVGTHMLVPDRERRNW